MINIEVNSINYSSHKVFDVIVKSFGAALFNLDSLLSLEFETMYAKSEIKLALLNLCKERKVLNLRRVAGERLYCVPFDIYIEHFTMISSDVQFQLIPLENFVGDGDSESQDVVMDMISLMGWIDKEQPKLNKKGQLDKKSVTSLLHQIQLSPNRIVELMGEDAVKHAYPIPIGILIDLGLRLQTISLREGQYTINREQALELLNHTPKEVQLILYHLWFQVHYPEHKVIRQLLVVIPILCCNHWFTVTDVYRWIMINLAIVDSSIEMEQHLLGVMDAFLLGVQELGWIQLGRTKDGVRTIRSQVGVDKIGSAIEEHAQSDNWFVQPNFEVIVPIGAGYINHYKFHEFTKLLSRNRMFTYLLTKDSIFTAFDRGWTAHEVIKHLKSKSRYELPHTVQHSIMDWDQQYRGVRLESVMIIKCETEAIAEQLMTIPDVANILNMQNRIEPKIFLIPDQDVDFIRDMMSSYGYLIEKKSITNRLKMVSNATPQTEGIYHTRIRYDMYTLDDIHPDIVSLYPGIAGVPSGWLNSYVTYHASTRKLLLQQSIDWQCYVQVAHNGEDKIIAPVLIIIGDQTTDVEGIYLGKKIRIALNELQSMRLIVPGVHDVTKYMSTTD